MTIINAIKDFIEEDCPLLKDFNASLNVEYLDSEYESYSIETVPCEPLVKRYINGDALKRYKFIFASREAYGGDTLQNLENAGFYEKFTTWMDKCNKTEKFPALGIGKEARSIKALTCGYIMNEEQNTAKYQVQCELIYFEKED